MSNNWTPDQQNAIEARGGGLIVSAAAGSGKTAVLVERVIRRILEDDPPVDIDRLLVVTFSKASAAEMRTRIGRRIREKLRQTPGDRNLLRQQMLLDSAHISTIHSFCYELVRQHFAQLGLSHDVRIGDEQELKLLRRAALQGVLSRRYAQPDNRGFFDLVELVSSSRSDGEMERLIESLYGFLRSHPFYEEWLDEKLTLYDPAVPLEKSPWGDIILGYAIEGLSHAAALLELALDRMDEQMAEAYSATFQADLATVQSLRDTAQTGNWDEMYWALQGASFGRLPPLRAYPDELLKKEITTLRNKAKDIVLKDLKERRFCATSAQHAEDLAFLAPRVAALFETVLEFDAEYAAAKGERRVLDYSDLEHMALQLLVRQGEKGLEKTELAHQLSAQLEEILVDEYQDTNSVQEMLFVSLSRDEENLFCVGDVKQSIYRFRLAMPELFIRRRENSCPYDGQHFPACVNLGKNFRSRGSVTETVNFLFHLLMSRRMGEIEYNEQEQLVCGADYPADDRKDCLTEVHFVPAGQSMAETRAAEADYTAAYVQQLLESRLPVGRGETRHPIRPEDICILLRSYSKRASDYAEALARRRIPAWANVETGFLESEEISSVLALLQVVDNPLLDMPLAQALLSPIFGLSADDLAAIRAADRRGSLYAAVQAAAANGNSDCQRFLQVLEDLRRHAAWESSDRVIRRLYDQTNFLRIARVMPAGKLRCDNLRLLVDYAADYEKRGFCGLSGFLGFVNRLVQQEGDLAPASEAAGGAVTIRSVHSSKGLEYPVVILADLDKQINRQDVRSNTQIHSRLGFACKRRDNERMIQFSTLPLEAARIEAEREQLSEELRVLYVALTRAQEKLVLVGAVRDTLEFALSQTAPVQTDGRLSPWVVRKGKSYLEWLTAALLQHPDGAVLCDPQAAGHLPQPADCCLFRMVVGGSAPRHGEGDKEAFRFGQPDPTLVAQFEQNARFVYPFAAESETPSKFAVSDLAHKQGAEGFCLSRPAFLDAEEMTAAQKGSATHKFMQYADYAAAAESSEGELERLVALGFLSRREADVVDCGAVGQFFASPLARRMAGAQRVLRELRFMGELGAAQLAPYTDRVGGSEPVVLQGVADCVLVEANGAVVIDYKTDRVKTPEELLRRYTGQLELYAQMLEPYLGCPVRECWIYSFALGRALRVC